MSSTDLRFHGTSQEGNKKALTDKRNAASFLQHLVLPNVSNILPIFSDTPPPPTSLDPNHLVYIVNVFPSTLH